LEFSMSRLEKLDAEIALEDIIFKDDEVVVIHVGVWSFALKFGWTTPEDIDGFIDLIADVVGDRTLIFPAYNFEFPRTGIFDLTLSPPQVGILPEQAWKRLDMKRTRQPMNSYFICGPGADEVLALPCTTAWGNDGVLAWMGKRNARICALGLSWEESISFVHRCEEAAAVPYRYFKKFTGTLYDNGEELGPCTEVLFTRPMNHMIEEDWSRVFNPMESRGQVTRAKNSEIPFASVLAEDVQDACLEVLRDDPYALAANAGDLRKWVETEREAEIASLEPNQRWD
jgi:aminoglycoside N3'-acetyltransferase